MRGGRLLARARGWSMDGGKAEDRGLLSDRIRNALTDEIAGGLYRAGTALDEQELANRFGASRTPVREALRQLAVSGLVEVRPRRGVIVARMTPDRIMDMFEAMAEVEAMCARLASSHREHGEILTVMAEGDGDAAARRMRAHMLKAASALEHYIAHHV